uniref:Uncharacterized protein n=1 Tax=Electrophorus electricus TaxID=8005 RepID=A0A4W4G3L3_ELEEL
LVIGCRKNHKAMDTSCTARTVQAQGKIPCRMYRSNLDTLVALIAADQSLNPRAHLNIAGERIPSLRATIRSRKWLNPN